MVRGRLILLVVNAMEKNMSSVIDVMEEDE
jgi:hypothetical protein